MPLSKIDSDSLNTPLTVTGTLTATTFAGAGTSLTGTAASLTAGNVTTNANLTGDVTSVGNAATVVKINGTTMSALATGILKNTTTTGVPSLAVAADFPTLNQNTTGSAATFTSTSQNSQFNSVGVGTAGSTTAGEIRATNNITAYYSSDIKFKENVQDIPNALSAVTEIGGKLFDWKDSYIQEPGGEDGYFVQKHDFGVIAQDVLAHFPVAARTRPDGSLAVDYEKLCALAFAAIKELNAKVMALENFEK